MLRTLQLSAFRGGNLAVHIGENIDNKEAEAKSLVVHNMMDGAILREGGVECGEDAATATGDFADFSNQIRLATKRPCRREDVGCFSM